MKICRWAFLIITLTLFACTEKPTIAYQSKKSQKIIQVSHQKPLKNQNCALLKTQMIKDYLPAFSVVDKALIKEYFDEPKLQQAQAIGANYVHFQLLQPLDDTLQNMSMIINYMQCDQLLQSQLN